MKIQSLSRLITNEIIVQRKALSHLNWSRCLNNVTNLESNPKSNQIDPIMVNRKFFLDESNPVNHLTRHIGMHYRMPNEIRNTIFAVHGWTDRHKLIFSAFGETAIMIRKYAIDVMEQIRNGEILNDRFQRIIFHGLTGSGKTMTLNHLIHFAHKSNYVLLHFNDILNLTRLPFEYKVSEFKKKEGRVDTPMNGTLLLQHFKAQNANLIKDLKVSKSYEWSLKEHTKEGEPLINVVNHGINRSDHSSDCYAVLIRELKLAAEQNLIKLVIAIDNVNFLYWPTDLRRPDFTYYTTLDVTITRAFRKLLASDFKNGLLVATTDKTNHPRWDPDEQNLSDDPYKLLLPHGVKELNNFKTLEVCHYTDFEFYNCLAYYNDRMFITHPKALTTKGLQQLRFVTTKLPRDVFEHTKWL